MFLRTFIRFGYFLLILLIALGAVEGCRNGLRVAASTDGGQPQQQPGSGADQELDSALAVFFEECLRTSAPNAVPNLKTTIEYAIQDTQWYRDARKRVCTAEKDTAECWISVLPMFLDTHSPMYGPTAQCICDWAGDCPSATYNARYKRETLVASNQGVGKSGKPTDSQEACRHLQQKQKRPMTRLQRTFTSCMTAKSVTPYLNESSLDGKSLTIFMRDHYSFCRSRVVAEFPFNLRVVFGLLLLEKFCPREGVEAQWRKNIVTAIADSMREDAPMLRAFEECEELIAEKFGEEFVNDTEKEKLEPLPPQKNVDGCLVKYADKCFNIVKSKGEMVAKAFERRCNKNGGQLADIYSTEHLRITMEAIRESRLGKSTHLFLGMKYDVERRQLLFSNENDATFSTEWRPGNPTPHSLHTEVLLYVDAVADEPAQGLYNRSTKFARHYALCEFDM